MTDSLVWESIECAAGCAYLFNGWVPHRSASNLSNVDRRAVFFTYNPAEEGEVIQTLPGTFTFALSLPYPHTLTVSLSLTHTNINTLTRSLTHCMLCILRV